MSIKTTKLTVAELCQLNTELSSEKGLLSERLPMVFKYHLSKIAKKAFDEQEEVNKLRDEAIRTLGTATPDGGFSISQFVEVEDKKKKLKQLPNPSFTSFSEDMNSLFSQERDVEHEEFFIDDLKNVESGLNFPVFFKLLDA
jgi:hypothetical protein